MRQLHASQTRPENKSGPPDDFSGQREHRQTASTLSPTAPSAAAAPTLVPRVQPISMTQCDVGMTESRLQRANNNRQHLTTHTHYTGRERERQISNKRDRIVLQSTSHVRTRHPANRSNMRRIVRSIDTQDTKMDGTALRCGLDGLHTTSRPAGNADRISAPLRTETVRDKGEHPQHEKKKKQDRNKNTEGALFRKCKHAPSPCIWQRTTRESPFQAQSSYER